MNSTPTLISFYSEAKYKRNQLQIQILELTRTNRCLINYSITITRAPNPARNTSTTKKNKIPRPTSLPIEIHITKITSYHIFQALPEYT
jgi:hypothetical protein